MSQEIICRRGAKRRRASEVSHGTHYYREATGKLTRVLPGLFISAEVALTQEVLMQMISIRQPQAVMNLISALSYHGMTTEIPAYLSVALPKGSYMPKVLVSSVKTWSCKADYLKIGCSKKQGKWGDYRVTSPERTLVDCFRYRNKLGIDIFLEALTISLRKSLLNLSTLADLSRVFRIEKLITPYITTALYEHAATA